MSRDTTAHVRGAQAVPTHKHSCVCVSQPLSSPTSTWLPAATAAAAETSRPRCPLGGGALRMRLLSHLCVAAIQWPIGMHRRHQATRPCPLTRFHERTLSFFHELRVAHWLHGPTSHFFVLCSSECAALRCRLLRSMCQHHQHHEQQQQMRLSPLLARVTAAFAADACAREQADRSRCH